MNETRWRYIFAGLALFGAASAAHAQQPPQRSPADDVGAAWEAHSSTRDTLMAKLSALLQDVQMKNARLAEREKRVKDLEDYAVKCGDKPGCFLPAPEEKP
jgi:hypothetical protein